MMVTMEMGMMIIGDDGDGEIMVMRLMRLIQMVMRLMRRRVMVMKRRRRRMLMMMVNYGEVCDNDNDGDDDEEEVVEDSHPTGVQSEMFGTVVKCPQIENRDRE